MDLKPGPDPLNAGRLDSGRWALLVTLVLALLGAVVLGVAVGSVPIPPAEVLDTVGRGLSGHLREEDAIIWDIRLPRVVMAVLVGACLSVCGGAFQGVFRNPLADPYLLGVASGAAVGATLGLTLDWPRALIPLVSLLTGLSAVLVTLALGRTGRRYPPTRLVLAGVAVSYTHLTLPTKRIV